ncbi:hypothetical protein E0H92_24835 [Kribbella speibonae]|uniref:Aminoglycoside phosphotransferase domain-containing protein n=1 Tax=Kribbella speibonae TaxID=1572660 RepID=A0A4R0IWD8_9ACTN|nr:hypothetical protein E0H92_24835 [Kribbella speibonae]
MSFPQKYRPPLREDAGVDNLLSRWGLQGYDVRPLTEGTNNTGFYVGDEFVLRIHRNGITPSYEHAVLRALSGLSFAVPVPVPVAGETAVRGELHGRPVLASLSHRIPGEHPARGDAPRAEACGRALAELDHALGRLDETELPQPPVWDGDLTNIHPCVPSIDRVTAILDFETAGRGHRAMDLAVGRFFFGEVGRPSAPFERGYLDVLPLTGAEVFVLRELELMREATSFVHWYGRYVEGQTTAEDLADRVERLRGVEDWARER